MKRLFGAVLILLAVASVAAAQCGPFGCPGGGSPAPYSGGMVQPFDGGWRGSSQPIFGGGSWGRVLPPPPEDPPQRGYSGRAPVSTTTPPGWLAHVLGASGSLIYKDENVGVVLTAYHVVQGTSRTNIPISFPDGQRFAGRVYEDAQRQISADKICDLAFVEIDAPRAEPVAIAEAKPPVGAPVWVVGYGGGRYAVKLNYIQTYTRGTWRGDGGPDASAQMRGDVAIGGDSGGALINAAGELVSVISTSDRRATTNGPSLSRINALCSDERFKWPWFRRGVKNELQRLDEEKAGRDEIPLPPPPDPPPGNGIGMEEIQEIINGAKSDDSAAMALADVVDENTQWRLKNEGLIDELRSARSKLLAMDPAALKTELGRTVQADVRESQRAAEEAAKKAAEKAVADAEPGLFERLKSRLSEGLIPGHQLTAITKLPGLLRNTWAAGGIGLAALAFAIWWVRSDLKNRRETGDALTIEKGIDALARGAQAMQAMAAKTSNTLDDRGAGALVNAVQRLETVTTSLADRVAAAPPPPPAQGK